MNTEKTLAKIMEGTNSAFIALDYGEGKMVSGLHGNLGDVMMGIAAALYAIHQREDIPLEDMGIMLNGCMSSIASMTVHKRQGETTYGIDGFM